MILLKYSFYYCKNNFWHAKNIYSTHWGRVGFKVLIGKLKVSADKKYNKNKLDFRKRIYYLLLGSE